MTTIPEIIDNREVLLKDVINILIKNTTDAKIAAGYFYLSGFEIIRENIKPNSNIDIIIGVETDEITAMTIQEGYEYRQEEIKNKIVNKITESIEYTTDDAREGINTLSQLIQKGNINVKIYTKEKFHSKAYIFDVEYDDGTIKDSYAIIGSSNFTRRGLGAGSQGGNNTELNAVLRQPSAVNEVKKWFNNIWDESEDFNIELLNIIDNNFKFKKLEYTPFDIILKSLYELYKNDEIYEILSKLNLDELAGFQEFAVYRAIAILSNYDGVIIADNVGLGKTYIAKGLLQYFADLDKSVLIICPASLKNMWANETKEIDVDIRIISQESIGMHGLSDKVTKDVDVIIIDEAHNFRNENANRFRELVKHTMGKKVVQLTATPVNNSIFDLYNIMTLFIKEDEFKDKYGIASVRDVFNNYPNEKDHVDNILSEIMIKRSRNFIKKKYGRDGELIVNGNTLKFPKRHIKTVNYSISSVYGEDIYDNIADRLENLYLPVISEEKLTSQQISLIIGLVRKTFLKRLESSVEAFRISIEKQIKYCELLLNSIDKGYLICKKYAMENIGQDTDIDIDETIDIDEYDGDINELINNIQSDYEDFEYMLAEVKKIDINKDVKLQVLINKLNGELSK
ncbi:SNF2-related protein [Schnuerera ultunensis]|uniref:Helicase, SNF2/RAD54 family, putative n=1 Tax=[Clostridium] ultunense Esp TaxID=1288971 RepID=A0A1M4PPV4_9FIRM